MSSTETATLPEVPDVRLKEASRRLDCLLQVAQTINSSLDLNVVLGSILREAKGILGAEGGSIMLMEEDNRHLRVVAAQGPRAERILGRRQSLVEGVAGWVVQHKEPVLIHGPASDPRFVRICERSDVRDALCAPLCAEDRILGTISLNNRLCEEPFTEADLNLLVALSNQAALAIRNATSFQEMRRQRQMVERLLQEVARAQGEERTRIALQLHDGPAQTMYAALRNLEAARVIATDAPSTLKKVMGELEKTIRQAIDETRAVMVDLRPPALGAEGLHAGLRQYADQFQHRTGIRTRYTRRGEDRRLTPSIESCLYRIVQEALTNVWKHSEALAAQVVLQIEETACTLEISDDGKGFAPETLSERGGAHLGISSLRERAELLGGTLEVASTPGTGTTVCVRVPLGEQPLVDLHRAARAAAGKK